MKPKKHHNEPTQEEKPVDDDDTSITPGSAEGDLETVEEDLREKS